MARLKSPSERWAPPIAKARGLDQQAELCILDVLKLDQQFEAGAGAQRTSIAVVCALSWP